MNKSKAVAKVGIIVGLIVLIVTFGIFFLAKRASEKKDVELTNKGQEVVEVVEDKNVKGSEEVETPVETQTPVAQPTENIEVKEKIVSQITDINVETLGNPNMQQEILVRIAKKGILLLDNSPETTENKMLAYYFLVYGPNNEDLTLFMTKAAYDAYNVSDTLLVNYAVYKNNNGVEFPIVLSVTDPNAVAVTQGSGENETPSE